MTFNVGSRFDLDSEVRPEMSKMGSFQSWKMSCHGRYCSWLGGLGLPVAGMILLSMSIRTHSFLPLAYFFYKELVYA